MKAFLFCETTDGGMVTHFYLEHQLPSLLDHFMESVGPQRPGDKWWREAVNEDNSLVTNAQHMKVGEVKNHRIGVFIRLADDHALVS